MKDPSNETSGHLERLSEAEIAHMLRGFPDAAVSGAIALRTKSGAADFEACLFGILAFYLPAGTKAPAAVPPADTRLREDLGLDSLSLAEAMFKVEELFNITVENTEIVKIETIADARRLLMEKLDSPSAPEEANE